MDNETQVIILPEPRPGASRPESGIERLRLLGVLADAGVKVRHDSGGRLLVVDASDQAVKAAQESGPDFDSVPLDGELTQRVGDLNAQDALFLQALQLRLSPEYQRRKSEMTPGESPEEQLLRTAPCTPPEG
ncbi:MAG: hypothetical protein ABI563_02930 [Specibacter sp.]